MSTITAIEAPEAPTGDKAFATLALAWLLELDVVAYLHPAVQAAYKDAYSGAHLYSVSDTDAKKGKPLTPYLYLPATAFTKNYDDYHLLRWNSNLAAREQMLRDFPQLAAPEPLVELSDVPAAVQEQVANLVEHRRQLPVIMRKGPLVDYGEKLRSARTRIEPKPPLRPSLGEDAPA
jgi:hypothetical protein